MSNPGGIDFNTSPYFDDFDEDKQFVRVLYRPGRAVQARELTQSQTLQQIQMKRFADYFFRQGTMVEGGEQRLDVNLNYVKLQANYIDPETLSVSEVDVEDFEGQTIIGYNSGVKAFCGIVSDIDGVDPKTLFINYLSTGTNILTVNNAPNTLTPGNTLTLSDGSTASIVTNFANTTTARIYVSNVVGALSTGTANTVDNTGTLLTVNITNVLDRTNVQEFDDAEVIFTANNLARSFANTAITNATRFVVNEGTADEVIYTKGSKFTLTEGTMYISDHFVKTPTQTIILDKYTNEPSYKIGVVPQKEFVDYIADPSLNDNAQGTPNFQAPGADRFKINPVLLKIDSNETTVSETEFIQLTEVVNGTVKKKNTNVDVDGKLEEALAKRTFEESGSYTLEDPRVHVREHLAIAGNGGRFTVAEGGNTNLLLVEVDPFTSYVGGFRNELLTKTGINLVKGLDTEYEEQVQTQINYGQYVRVKEHSGSFDFMESTEVTLYNVPQESITNGGYSRGTAQGTQIGTARIRAVEYISGTQGTADAEYNVYLYEININPANTFSEVRSIAYTTASPANQNVFADIVVSSGSLATLRDSSFNKMIFTLPYDAIRTIRDDNQQVESGFQFEKRFSVSFSTGAATIVSTDSSETFQGTGVLSDRQEILNYRVIVKSSGANAESSIVGGAGATVTVSSGTTSVIGSGTAFNIQVNPGDLLNIDGETIRVAEVTSNTALTLESPHSAGATSVNYTKVFPSGYVIDLNGYGGTGLERSIDVLAPGTVLVDIKEEVNFTADVVAIMNRANAREKRKNLVVATETNINPDTHPNGITGPFSLGYGDIYAIRAIYQSADFSNPATDEDEDVTANYFVDTGQTDYSYEHGFIEPLSGITPTGRLLVVFDHFTHETTQGIGYCSVDSYPINDANPLATQIRTSEIPLYISSNGDEFNLRNCIDFRPIKTANTAALNPLNNLGYQIPSGGLHTPRSGSNFTSDLIYYKGRIVKVYVNQRGEFGINSGAPKTAGNRKPSVPPALPDTLEIAEVSVPPYPSLPSDVNIKLIRNRRFTMKDIAKISEKVDRLEYYTTLGFLEKQASSTIELDEVGLDRFKNGILVDPFTGAGVADIKNADYRAAINRVDKYGTCYQDNTKHSDMNYLDGASSTIRTPGRKIFIPYTEEVVTDLNQLQASRFLNLAEELTFVWAGRMDVIPSTDNWIDQLRDPTQDIVYDDSGNADAWGALIDAWNTEVAPNSLHWIGKPTETIVDKTKTAVTTSAKKEKGRGWTKTITSAIVQTSQQAFVQEASFTPGDPQRIGGDRVVDITAAHHFRSRDFIIDAGALKDGANLYAFFDGESVTANCTQIRLINGSTLNDVFDLMDNNGRLPHIKTITVDVAGTGYEEKSVATLASQLNSIDRNLLENSSARVADATVTITDSTGTGAGATAYALLNATDGIGRIIVTNPGYRPYQTPVVTISAPTIDPANNVTATAEALNPTAELIEAIEPTGTLKSKQNRCLAIFRVPESKFFTGIREFKLTDHIGNDDALSTTNVKKSIQASGITQTKSQTVINTRPFTVDFDDPTLRKSVGKVVKSVEFKQVGKVRYNPPPRRDPLSQSFVLDEAIYTNGAFVTSIDLYFRTKSEDSSLGATVEIREMENGFPTQKIIGGEIARVENADIAVDPDTALVPTTFTFSNPVYLKSGVSYCFTVKPDANSTDFSIWVAELGAFDISNPDIEVRIEKQPSAGIVFTSSDDYSWTTRQNIDLKFTMRVASFDTDNSYTAVWQNVDFDNPFQYNSFEPLIEDIEFSTSSIEYSVVTTDAGFNVYDPITIKNLTRNDLQTSMTLSDSTTEELENFKSITLGATLRTLDPYTSPYIDDDRVRIALSRNIINNSSANNVTLGTVRYVSGDNYVIGSGTDFGNTIFTGEYVNFGNDQFRRVSQVVNNTFMYVATNFTAANGIAQTMSIRSEENPYGPYESSSRYITRIVTLNDGFEASDMVVYLSINRPSVTDVKVYAKLLNENDFDKFEEKFYTELQIDGAKRFTEDSNEFFEEKYVIPANIKTGGSDLLSGTVSAFTANTAVFGVDSKFLEQLKIGDTIAVGVNREERVVSTIANNEFLTVESAFSANTSGADVFKILNNITAYTTPDGRTFEGFKYFAIKVVFLSADEAYAPKIRDLRSIALA